MSWKGLGADRPFVGRERSEGWEVSERLYGAIGEKSIDFRKILYRLSGKTLQTFLEYSIDFLEKLYRLFPDTSVQKLGQHVSNDLFLWEERSVLVVLTMCLFDKIAELCGRIACTVGQDCLDYEAHPIRQQDGID